MVLHLASLLDRREREEREGGGETYREGERDGEREREEREREREKAGSRRGRGGRERGRIPGSTAKTFEQPTAVRKKLDHPPGCNFFFFKVCALLIP